MNNCPIIFIVIIGLIITIDAQPSSNCKTKLNQCQTNFFDELKQYKFSDHEMSYYQLCSSDGTYMRYVDCIRQINENDPDCKQPLHRELCNKRGMKIFTYRYMWKSNLAHDICYRTSPLIDQDFFKHEKCISEVLNTPKWHCDLNHYEKTKKPKDLDACQHWKSFRQCIYDDVAKHCGEMVANVSDFLFHTHSSYFSVYTTCNLSGEPHTKCWLDLIDSIPRMPSPTTEPLITTTVTTAASTTTTTRSTTSFPLSPKTVDELLEKKQTTTIAKQNESESDLHHDHFDHNDEELMEMEKDELNNSRMNTRTNLIREAKLDQNNQHDEHVGDHDQNHNEQYSMIKKAVANPQQFNDNHSKSIYSPNQLIALFITIIVFKLILS